MKKIIVSLFCTLLVCQAQGTFFKSPAFVKGGLALVGGYSSYLHLCETGAKINYMKKQRTELEQQLKQWDEIQKAIGWFAGIKTFFNAKHKIPQEHITNATTPQFNPLVAINGNILATNFNAYNIIVDACTFFELALEDFQLTYEQFNKQYPAIRDKYRKLQLDLHPDRHFGKELEAAARTTALNNAYQYINDQTRFDNVKNILQSITTDLENCPALIQEGINRAEIKDLDINLTLNKVSTNWFYARGAWLIACMGLCVYIAFS